MRSFKTIALGLGVLIFTSCSHKVQKADIPASAIPAVEIQKLETNIEAARAQQYEVLAHSDFRSAEEMLGEAKSDFQKSKESSEVLANVAYAQGYLDRAKKSVNDRQGKWHGVLKTRQLAITAGAKNDYAHGRTLSNIDEDLVEEIDSNRELTSDRLNNFQTQYMDLELAALKTTQLKDARHLVSLAKNDHRAEKDAPKALKQAQVDLANAENMVTAHRSNPAGFKADVEKSNASAILLMDIITVAHQSPGKTVDEDTARGIVMQNRKVTGLQGQMADKDSAISMAKGQTAQANKDLQAKDAQLAVAGATIGMQQAIDSARQKFSESEAEVYQQGDKLLIRLKAINFPSGRANVPTSAFPLLAKVKDVATELNPQEVMVEGHTDSIGNPLSNKKLSTQRAQAVVAYLENNGLDEEKVDAVGYGFEKPIATNKTSAGRSQNRRVDVIITPSR